MKIDVLEVLEENKVGIKSVEIGEPGFGEIQIDIKACGICAWDRYLFQGKSTDEAFPYQFGHEGAGIVTKLGPGVENFEVGDKVFCTGAAKGMSQVVNYPTLGRATVVKIPDDVTDFSQWIGEPVCCIVNGIDQLDITPGDNIVVIGTGYMGMLTIQGLNKTLAGKVIGFDINDKRLELAKEFGADEVYNAHTEEGKKVYEELKNSGGVDIVIEASSSAEGLENAIKILKTGGTLSLFAWHRGERTFDGSRWHLGGFKIINTSPMYDEHYADRIPQAATLMKKGVFRQDKLVTHVMDYHDAQEILEIARDQKDGYIKGVITF